MLNLRQELQKLYPTKPNLADEVELLLKQNIPIVAQSRLMIGRERTDGYADSNRYTSKSEPTRPFSEKDIVLILYPDHISEKGKPSLDTLSTFLDTYVQDAVNTIHLLPFYPSGGDGGFAVADYENVDPKYGMWNHIAHLAKKYRIMVDFVANHTAITHKWFVEFLNGNKKYQDYYVWFDKPIDTSWAYRTRTTPLLTPFEKKDGSHVWVWTGFSPIQPDLNYQNPDVFLAMTKILIHYLRMGASLIRIDAAGYLWKQAGTPSVHMQQTHTIIAIWRAIMAEIKPSAYLITETNVPNNINVQYFGKTIPEAHMVYNFGLSSLLLYTFMEKDSTVLTNWAGKLHTPRTDTTYFSITQTHDGVNVHSVDGVLSTKQIAQLGQRTQAKGGGINSRLLADGTTEFYELAIVYKSFLGSSEALIATQAIALSMMGIPGIYFNSFIGGENWKQGVEKTHEKRAINRRKYTLEEITGLLQKQGDTLLTYKHMLSVRAHEPLFAPHIQQKILFVDSKVFCVQRTCDKKKLLALTNISDTLVSIDSTKVLGKIKEATDILTNRSYRFELNPIIFLKPYQSVWIKVQE